MARPIRGIQRQESILDTFKKELPGLMIRYVLDNMSRNKASELQKDRMNYEMNLNVVSDYITDLNSEKRKVTDDLEVTKDAIEGSLSALKAHSSENITVDEFTTVAGSSKLPDYIMNNVILSPENKEVIGKKAGTVAELSAELDFYKNQKNELITVNAALDRIDSTMEKNRVDPGLVGEGMMGYVTDEHDMQAYWDANFKEIFDKDPSLSKYKDVIKDVFMQQTPTSSDQKTDIANYIKETKSLRNIDENEFLNTAANSLASIQTDGQLQWQGFLDPDDTTYNLDSAMYDDMRATIKKEVGFVNDNTQANQYILNSIRNMSMYTDPFSFYVDVLDEQRANVIQTRIAEQFFPVATRELRSAHSKYSGAYSTLFQILQEAKANQDFDVNSADREQELNNFTDEILNLLD